MLDEAWEDPKTNIIEFVAFGGVGKSALVANWLKEMQTKGWGGAACVLGHSFYSQGSREDAQASADSFINEALQFFGDDDPTAGSPWDKGERLARLVRAQPTLLILDGVEPLQHPGSGNIGGSGGQIRDPGLAALVRELAAGTNGLVVISTRVQVQDIEGWEDSSVRYHELDHLSVEAGSALLKEIGVRGSDEQIAAAVDEVNGHALAVNLLGTFLCHARNGHVENRHEIGLREMGLALAPEAGRGRNPDHAAKTFDRIMARYELWLSGLEDREGTVDRSGRVALEILRLTGLFDRPITAGEFAALLGGKPIDGLTESVCAASEDVVNLAVHNLVGYGLITKLTDSPLNLDIPAWPDPAGTEVVLDAHPLIREYFSEQLERTKASEDSSFILPPSSFKEAHRRLYEHLKQSAPELPDNLNDMMPLFHAVAHGCKAGLWQDALDRVYGSRISRSKHSFSTRTLNAWSQTLSSLSGFFSKPWAKVDSGVTRPESQAYLLQQAGWICRSEGRTREAVEALRASHDLALRHHDKPAVATAARNLSQTLLYSGQIADAAGYAQEAVWLSPSDSDQYAKNLSRLADALQYAGESDSAQSAFEEAASITKKYIQGVSSPTPRDILNASFQWFLYCSLLYSLKGTLEKEDINKFESLVSEAEYFEKDTGNPLGMAVIELCRGWTHILGSNYDSAEPLLNKAIVMLTAAGERHQIPRGFLTRAALFRLRHASSTISSVPGKSCSTGEQREKDLTKAHDDLSEAESIAERGDMLIWQIEAALERTRLALERMKYEGGRMKDGLIAQAREKLEEARRLIKQTEKAYEPHVPDWDKWEPPEYVGVFKKGEIVGYHCRNDEIERLQKQIDSVEEQ